jgi:hypothetical protein
MYIPRRNLKWSLVDTARQTFSLPPTPPSPLLPPSLPSPPQLTVAESHDLADSSGAAVARAGRNIVVASQGRRVREKEGREGGREGGREEGE